MKRLVAVVVVLTIVFCVFGAYADTDRLDLLEMMSQYADEMLKGLIEMHDKDPSVADEAFIIMLHGYYALRSDLISLYKIESSWMWGNPEVLLSPVLTTERLHTMKDLVNERYNLWLDGKISNEEIASFLITLARVYTDTGN